MTIYLPLGEQQRGQQGHLRAVLLSRQVPPTQRTDSKVADSSQLLGFSLPKTIKSNHKNLEVSINDDGPGFPDDIKEILGEPYIKSKSTQINSNAGTGLGTFLGKTLLERKSAKLNFLKDNKLGGASVNIIWNQKDLKSNA